MDLVDEEQVALLEAGEQAGEVGGFFDDRAGGDAHVAAHLGAEDEGERGLAQAGRAAEQDVVEGLAAGAGGADHDLEALDGLGLAGEVGKRERAQRGLGVGDGRGELRGEVAQALDVGGRGGVRGGLGHFRGD